jgi:hypothetical protein
LSAIICQFSEPAIIILCKGLYQNTQKYYGYVTVAYMTSSSLISCVKDTAQRVNMLNVLGVPMVSAFFTLLYSSSSHLDKDETPTSGRVLHRDPMVSVIYFRIFVFIIY